MSATTVGARPERRLVEHEEPGPAHQRLAKGEHLPFPSGEKRGRLFRSFPEDRKKLEDLLQVFLQGLGIAAPEIAPEL